MAVIELVRGDNSEIGLFHGATIPVQARISQKGAIRYYGPTRPTPQERKLIYRTICMIGGPKQPFPGYYEWFVSGGKVIFRNYQGPDTVYGSLNV